MKHRKMWTTVFALVLGLASLSFKCDGGGDPKRKLVKAADDIAGAISAMIDAKRDLAGKSRITADEERRLTQLLTVANDADAALINRLKATTAVDASNRSELLSLLSNVTSSITDLNQSGVLRLGNSDAQKRLSQFITSINAAIQILSQIQTMTPTPTPTH